MSKSRKRQGQGRSKLVLNVGATEGLVRNLRTEIVFNLTPSKKLVRNERLQGRDYLAVPMVMITEGVHKGSNGALFYPGDELSKTPCVWNMKPVVVNHPEENGEGRSACDPDVAENYQVGMIMNTRFDDKGRLVAEAWVEPALADAVEPRVMKAIENEQMMELSTGVFVDKEFNPGEFDGEAYDAIARNYRPDHLAILPDKRGACSIDDGAGFMRNQAAEIDEDTLVRVLTYNAGKPSEEDEEQADLDQQGDSKHKTPKPMEAAHAASRDANRKGAWAVISGTKKAHDGAAELHSKAARLYAKAGHKAFSDWHTTKANDHKNWGDEAEAASTDNPKPAKNRGKRRLADEHEEGATENISHSDALGGTDAGANDDEGEWSGTEESDAATAAATERSNQAMSAGVARAHRSAAIAHRYAASAHRRANNGQDSIMSAYHTSAAKLHDGMAANCDKVTANKVLTAKSRNRLPDSAFALPGRRYPIHDRRHAAAAKSRVSQHGSPKEKAIVRAKVARRYPTMGKNEEEEALNEISFDDIRQQISKKLRDGKSDGSSPGSICTCWVTDVFDDSFVYDDGSGKLFKQAYSVDGDDQVSLEGEPEAVVRKTSYEPATNEAREGTNTMDKKQLIESLIKNHGWTEKDRKYLTGLPEERLEELHKQGDALAQNTREAIDHATVADADEDSDAEDNQDDDRGAGDSGGTAEDSEKKGKGGKATLKDDDPATNANKGKGKKPLSLNAFLRTVPPEVSEMVTNGVEAVQAEISRLVEYITQNEANEYTEEELMAMPLKQLRKLAKLAGGGIVENDTPGGRAPLFNGQGQVRPVQNQEGEDAEVLEAPVMNFEEEAKAS